uniref:Guanylate cyclase n=1 Tax=Gasterosteus aculeatus aculeatus TaxID=481459 RepID=G3Q4C6_GASAC
MAPQRRAFLPQRRRPPPPPPPPPPFCLTNMSSPAALLLPSLLRLLLLASLCSPPRSAQAAWFRVGVVGPWGCDPLFAKALPAVAAQLAVDRVNGDPALSRGGAFDFVLLQEPCETSRALERFLGFHTKASGFIGPANPAYCDAASMLSKGWNKALFPWGCVGHELDDVRSHPTFAHSAPRPTRVLLSLISYFRWAHVAVISSSEDVWAETGSKVADSLRSHGLPVRLVSVMENSPLAIRRTLTKLREMIVVLCMHSALIGGGAQKRLLEAAYDMRLIDGSLVFVPYDALLYSLPHRNVSYPALRRSGKLLRAYDAVLTVTADSPGASFYEAYGEAGPFDPVLPPPPQVSPLFGTVYSSVLFVAHAVNRVREAGERMSGSNLNYMCDFTAQGFSHRIRTSDSGAALLDFLILDTDGVSWELKPTHRSRRCYFRLLFYLNTAGAVRFIGREIHFPRGYGPRKDSSCWFTRGVLCSGGQGQTQRTQTHTQVFNNLNHVFELDMRHENVNLFLGFFHDCGVFAIVTEFCSRGSLEDLLLNDDVKLDWMFKSSLLLDLIKGMKYLHHRGVSHTRLKSRNCVVDGRFVLKVTDYGYNEVLEAQRFPYVEPPAEELLWTAPEILRGCQPELHGSLCGDVYSFAIIMQEVVVRGAPYCMMDMPTTEIIEKLRKPPPLFRPVVSSDFAPLECIQLMKQCWNEQPDKRPGFEEVFDQFKNINKGKKTNIIDSMLRMLEQYSSNLEELIRERTEELEIEKQKTEKLLTQMLPPSVAEVLKVGGTVEPEHFDSVSLYFSDIVGFTTISAHSEPIEVVDLLNDLYTIFDAIIGNHDVYKVETIGDAYMVASGVPVPNDNRHAAEIANMALDILSAVGTFKMRHMPDVPVRIRIGLHTGPCVAGVVGLTMPRYCLFGDTVTTASRMESSGLPQRIHIHQSTARILQDLNLGYKVELRGKREVKGKGMEETFWLVGKDGFNNPLPVPPEVKSG